MKKRLPSVLFVVGVLCMSMFSHGAFIPNDTYWDDQWGPQEINIHGAWDYTGKGQLTNPGLRQIVIAVIDSGITQDHPDLANVLWRNQDEFIGDYGNDSFPGLKGVDDDCDGFADWEDKDILEADWDGNGDTFEKELEEHNGNATQCPDYQWVILDDDENGYPDDINGWNFVKSTVAGKETFRTTENKNIEDEGILRETSGMGENTRVDCQLQIETYVCRTYHGTHCAGSIAALIDNNEGIAGGGKFSIMPLVVFNKDFNYMKTGPERDAENLSFEYRLMYAIEYAYENGADVISMSLGNFTGPLEKKYEIEKFIEDAYVNGTVLVAAAGNKNQSLIEYPARNQYVIAVGSATTNGTKVRNSNYGGNGTIDENIELVAPSGDGIYAIVGPTATVDDDILSTSKNDLNDTNDLYVYMGGTSAAVPFVVATAALVMSNRPSLTAEEVRHVLRMTATDLVTPKPYFPNETYYGWDIYSGWGLVNTFDAVRYASYQKNWWSKDHREHLINQIAGSPNLAIDMDSHGYSHIAASIWNGTNDVINWMSLDHRGSIYKGPVEVGGEGRDTRIKVDWRDDIHITWVEGFGVIGNLWYTKIDYEGNCLIDPIQLTNGNNQIYGLDLVTTDDLSWPEAIVVYSIKPESSNSDIYQIRIDENGNPSAPVGLIVRANNQYRMTGDIFSVSGSEYIQIAFVDSTDDEIHWAVFDLNGVMQDLDGDTQPDEAVITNDSRPKYDLCLKAKYFGGESVLVWQKMPTQSFTPRELMLHTLSPQPNAEGTYLTTYSDLIPGLTIREPVMLDHVDSNWFGRPKVAINAWDEVLVVWDYNPNKTLYFVSMDGRVYKSSHFGESWNKESVIAATYGDSNRRSPFDMDGNFYLAYEAFNPLKCLRWKSSGETFKEINTIETAAYRHSLGQSDHAVDDFGGVHVVWADYDMDNFTRNVYYEYYEDNDLSTPTISATKVSVDLNGNSSEPVIALHSYIHKEDNYTKKIYGYIAWIYRFEYNEKILYDLYARGFHIESGDNSTNWTWGPEESEADYGQSSQWDFVKGDPDIVSYVRPFIQEGPNVTAPERRYAIAYTLSYESSFQEIILGTLDVNNSNGRIINNFGFGNNTHCNEPSVDADPLGYIYLTWHYQENHWIYWIQVYELGTNPVTKKIWTYRLYTNYPACRPIIRVDQEANRRNESVYHPSSLNERMMRILYVTEKSTDEFTFCIARYMVGQIKPGSSQWQFAVLLYDDYEVVPSYTGAYFTEIPQVDAAMDNDNRLHIIIVGDLRMPFPWKWPGHQAFNGLWYAKLDYESSVLTNEMYLNREYSCVGDPSIAIDRKNDNHVHCLVDRGADDKIYGFTHTYKTI